jgi:hypothetical protein
MENRIKELEELVGDLEKQVWVLTDLVQLLAEDAIESNGEFSGKEKEHIQSLLKKL